MLKINNLIGFGVGGRTLELKGFVRELDPAVTIDVPSYVKTGQLLVLADRVTSNVGISSVTPSGFTEISNVTGGSVHRRIISYKRTVGGEASSTLTGMSGNTNENKLLLIFGWSNDTPINSVTVTEGAGEITNSTPATQNKTFSTTNPTIIYAFGSGDAGFNFSPSADALIEMHTSSNNVAYKIYQNSPQATAINMPDGGSNNSIQSCNFILE